MAARRPPVPHNQYTANIKDLDWWECLMDRIYLEERNVAKPLVPFMVESLRPKRRWRNPGGFLLQTAWDLHVMTDVYQNQLIQRHHINQLQSWPLMDEDRVPTIEESLEHWRLHCYRNGLDPSYQIIAWAGIPDIGDNDDDDEEIVLVPAPPSLPPLPPSPPPPPPAGHDYVHPQHDPNPLDPQHVYYPPGYNPIQVDQEQEEVEYQYEDPNQSFEESPFYTAETLEQCMAWIRKYEEGYESWDRQQGQAQRNLEHRIFNPNEFMGHFDQPPYEIMNANARAISQLELEPEFREILDFYQAYNNDQIFQSSAEAVRLEQEYPNYFADLQPDPEPEQPAPPPVNPQPQPPPAHTQDQIAFNLVTLPEEPGANQEQEPVVQGPIDLFPPMELICNWVEGLSAAFNSDPPQQDTTGVPAGPPPPPPPEVPEPKPEPEPEPEPQVEPPECPEPPNITPFEALARDLTLGEKRLWKLTTDFLIQRRIETGVTEDYNNEVKKLRNLSRLFHFDGNDETLQPLIPRFQFLILCTYAKSESMRLGKEYVRRGLLRLRNACQTQHRAVRALRTRMNDMLASMGGSDDSDDDDDDDHRGDDGSPKKSYFWYYSPNNRNKGKSSPAKKQATTTKSPGTKLKTNTKSPAKKARRSSKSTEEQQDDDGVSPSKKKSPKGSGGGDDGGGPGPSSGSAGTQVHKEH